MKPNGFRDTYTLTGAQFCPWSSVTGARPNRFTPGHGIKATDLPKPHQTRVIHADQGFRTANRLRGNLPFFFAISAAVAYLLFDQLPDSTASAEGSLGGLGIKAGGGIAGFLISFWLLHRAYQAMAGIRTLSITGNVFDADDEPVADAIVSVDGVDRQRRSDPNGWFRIDVDEQPDWTLRARTDSLAGSLRVEAAQVQRPVRLVLKKKVRG